MQEAWSGRELRRARVRGVVPEEWKSRACPSARPKDARSPLSGGSSQRPTAWATPVVVVSSVVAPKACRVHGVAGVGEVGSRRVVQAGDAGVVPRAYARLGTECGTRAAE